VTLSACHSGEVAPLIGREAFGLVIGLLGGGVRAVLAALWPVADAETRRLMWRFYQHRLLHGPPAALALAQREMLAANVSPLFWAPFALFGDPQALPPPTLWWRWLARLQQKRHRRHLEKLLAKKQAEIVRAAGAKAAPAPFPGGPMRP
jgi:hypothetical protein